jgi:hypothetical protein
MASSSKTFSTGRIQWTWCSGLARVAHGPLYQVSWVGGLIVRAIAAWQHRVARARHLAAPQTGAITFVQRFG